MTKKEFYDALELMRSQMSSTKVENSLPEGVGVFSYANFCDEVFKHNIIGTTGAELDTQYYFHLSACEAECVDNVLAFVVNQCIIYCDNIKKLSELVLCVNWKAWEHADRRNEKWSRLYSKLFCTLDEMILEYYEGREDDISYYIQYLD